MLYYGVMLIWAFTKVVFKIQQRVKIVDFTNCKTKQELAALIKLMPEGIIDSKNRSYSQKYLTLLLDLILIYGYKPNYAPIEHGFREAVVKLDPFNCKHNRRKILTSKNLTCDGLIEFGFVDGDVVIEKKITVYPLLAVGNDGKPVYGELIDGFPRELKILIEEILRGFGYKEERSGEIKMFGHYISIDNLEMSITLAEQNPCGLSTDSQHSFVSCFIFHCDTQVLRNEEQKQQGERNTARALARMEFNLGYCKNWGYPGVFVTQIGSIPMLPEFM